MSYNTKQAEDILFEQVEINFGIILANVIVIPIIFLGYFDCIYK